MEKQPKARLSNGNTREDLIARLPIPGPGRPKETEQDKIKKRAIKELIKEYQENLAQALPNISPVLIKKAEEGDIQAMKELHDRVMGKAPQTTDITSKGQAILVTAQEAIDRHAVPRDTEESSNE